MVRICLLVNFRWQLIATMALVLLAEPATVEARTYEADLAQRSFDRLIAERQYREAAESAKQLISSLLKDPDHNQLQYAEALTQLATAQHRADAFDSARQNYLLAIDIIEDDKDRLNSALIAPLLGLSRNYVAAGQYQDGIKSYKRTLHIHQVNMGLYDNDKAQIIAELSEVYFELGAFSRANAMQDSYVVMVNRAHPGIDLAQLPSLYSRADMLSRTGAHLRALNAYRRIISLIERAEGPRSLKLLPAFDVISKLLADHYIVDGDNGFDKARRYLRRAVDIAENNEDADPIIRADAHIMMGDFLSERSPNRNSMLRSYRHGWDELSKDVQYHERRDDIFAQPLLLNQIPAGSSPAMIELLANATDPGTTKNGVIIVRYDINEFGRPANVRIIESVPAKYHDYIVMSHVKNFAFRPQFVGGEAIISRDMSFEIRFSYRDDDLPLKMRQNMVEVSETQTVQ